jgi:hypothetical protein
MRSLNVPPRIPAVEDKVTPTDLNQATNPPTGISPVTGDADGIGMIVIQGSGRELFGVR